MKVNAKMLMDTKYVHNTCDDAGGRSGCRKRRFLR